MVFILLIKGDGLKERMLDLSSADVKRIREKTEMTQKEFSDVFGINLSTLRHWERGDRIPQGSSVILLNLIDKSPRDVYSILERNVEGDVKNSENKEGLKSVILNGSYKSLSDLTSLDFELFKRVILALIAANGIPYHDVKSEGDGFTFYAGHSQKNLKPIFYCNADRSDIKGDFLDVIENTFKLIYAIEHELSDAIYLPHEMRQKRVDSVILKLKIDVEFYSNVLKNW